MPEPRRPPATIRISRPWGSEKEFVEGDLAYLGRTGIILPNAPPCEVGELIRFEIVLADGAPVFRGEGHVLAYHPPGGTKPAGLEVRFARIDARSKLIVDRVRERRTALSRQGTLTPGAGSMAPGIGSLAPGVGSLVLGAAVAPAPLPRFESLPAPTTPGAAKSGVRSGKPISPVPPPPNRNEILDRLRARAKRLEAAGGFSGKKN